MGDNAIDSVPRSREDEHPDVEAGPGGDRSGSHPQTEHPRTAQDVEEAHRQLIGWTEDELGQVPLLPVGVRLDAGATYVDLRDPARREFTATGEMQVPPDGLYVPRSGVDHRTWVRLLGVRTAEWIGQA
jgi:hypothetical protein